MMDVESSGVAMFCGVLMLRVVLSILLNTFFFAETSTKQPETASTIRNQLLPGRHKVLRPHVIVIPTYLPPRTVKVLRSAGIPAV